MNLHQHLSAEHQPSFDAVVIGASAGGLAALTEVIGGLPADFPAAVLVVQHLAKNFKSLLSEILSRSSALKIKEAVDGELIEAGTVYIAAPDRHLLVTAERKICLSSSPAVAFLRPSIDLLFESASEVYKQRLVSVILTGSGHDGSKGVQAVSKHGGRVIVQSEETAQFRAMPNSAIQTGEVNWILPVGKIASFLVQLLREETR